MTALPHSAPMTVLPEWTDYNGHMNMAYYSVLMDETVGEAYSEVGLGPAYRTRTGFTTYIAEFHIRYLRELHEGDRVTSTVHLIDYDSKRFHIFQQLWHEDGCLAATGEGLTLHVDQNGDTPKVAPMPAEILAKFAAMTEAQKHLPTPEGVGRKIGITQK